MTTPEIVPGQQTLVPLNNTVLPGNAYVPNAGGPGSVVVDQAKNLLFVGSESPTVITAFNLSTGAAVATIGAYGPNGGSGFGFSPKLAIDTGRHLLFSFVGSPGPLEIIDISSFSIRSTINYSGSSSPGGLDFNPFNHELYVADFGTGNVTVVNTTTLASAYVVIGQGPLMVFADPVTGQVLVSNDSSLNLTIIDPFTNLITGHLVFASQPEDVGYDAGNRTLWVTTLTGIVVLNATTLALIRTISTGGLAGAEVRCGGVNPLCYLLKAGSGSVSPFDGITYQPAGPVGVGADPAGETALPGVGVVVVNRLSDNVSIINATTNSVTQTFGVATGPIAGTYDPMRSQVIVVDAYGPYLWAIDPSTHHIVKTVTLSAPASDVIYDPHSQDLFVALSIIQFGSVVVVLKAVNLAFIKTLTLSAGFGAQALGIDPVANRLWVSTLGFPGTIATVNLNTITESGSISLNDGSPGPMTWDPADSEMFVGFQSSNNITIIDGPTERPIGSVSIPGGVFGFRPLTYDPYDGNVYVGQGFGASSIGVIHAQNHSRGTNLSVGNFFTSALTTVSTHQLLYVADLYAGDVGLLNTTTGRLLQVFPVGNGPTAFVYDPLTSDVYVVNEMGGTISIFPAIVTLPPLLSIALHNGAGVGYVGLPTTFSLSSNQSTSSLNISYSGLPVGCVSQNSSTLTCTPARVGNYSVLVVAYNTTGVRASALLTFDVFPPITLANFTATPAHAHVAGTLVLNVTATGGARWLNLSYQSLPSGCASQNTTRLVCSPYSAGIWTVGVTATDSVGMTVSITTTAVTFYALAGVHFRVTPGSAHLGDQVNFSSFSQGGFAPFTYTYTGLPPGCPATNTGNFSCVPTATGSYPIQVHLVDSLGEQTNGSVNLSVQAPFSSSGSGFLSLPIEFALIAAAVVLGAVIVILRYRRRPPPDVEETSEPAA